MFSTVGCSVPGVYHEYHGGYLESGFLLGIFFGGGGAKSIVMQLFSDQMSGRGKSFQGGNCLRGRPCPSVEESQEYRGGCSVPWGISSFVI